VPLEPDGDAVRVERVRAPWEEAELVVVAELMEADGALERVVPVPRLHDPVLPHVAVDHQRQLGDRGGVEPSRPASRQLHGGARALAQWVGVVVGTEHVEAGQGKERDEEGEEDCQEDGDGHPTGDFAVGRLGRRPRCKRNGGGGDGCQGSGGEGMAPAVARVWAGLLRRGAVAGLTKGWGRV
jgi:hypothetical protein